MERSMALASSGGLMGQSTRASSKTTIFMERATTNGQTEESTLVTGLLTRCMEMECLSGLMEGVTRDNT